jgi:hypothetical protein
MLQPRRRKETLLLKLGAAHEIAAFADKLAFVRLKDSSTLRAVLFVFIDRGG